MKNNKDLSRAERLEIRILLDKGYSLRGIAKAMKRGKSTISYEIKENGVNGVYDPLKSEVKEENEKTAMVQD
jgi:IS30 family transposase